MSAAEPTIVVVDEYLILGALDGRRLTAVRGAWGWNVCWRKGQGNQLEWRSLDTDVEAAEYLRVSLLAGVS